VARVQVIGIGSPFGDDRLGWEAAEQLSERPEIRALAPGDIAITVRDRPGVLLLNEWSGAEKVILLDAVCSGATPGSLHCIGAESIRRGSKSRSSHGFGVAETLALAAALGQDLSCVVVRGVELDRDHGGEYLSEPVRVALPQLVEKVIADVLAAIASPVCCESSPD
jgi:hydrogenase maturation protease